MNTTWKNTNTMYGVPKHVTVASFLRCRPSFDTRADVNKQSEVER